LTPSTKQDENTITDILKNNWILQFGSPKEIHVDRWKSFESSKVADLEKEVETELKLSIPYYHNTNYMVEWQFRTIREYINATLKDRNNMSWARLLPDIEFSLNATVQKLIGVSLTEVVFERTSNRSGWFEDNRTNRDDIIKDLKTNNKKM